MTGTNFAIIVGGGVRDADAQPTQRPDSEAAAEYSPVVRARSSAAVKQDELRRPQAGVLYRALKLNLVLGLSWKECWALGEGNDEWAVGPIVVWMRRAGVDIEARYDAVAGETRFFLVLPDESGS